jgi:CelD/BcsL family acetyltransferase involved in cellulose biosynthesis
MRQPFVRIWPPLPPSVYVRRPRESLPFPLEEESCEIFVNARHGLLHGARALGLERGDEVLMPAYHHGTEVEALIAAGVVCRFYDATESLEPDEAVLDGLLTERTRALYVIHYYGFPQDCARWRAWCDDRGLLLLEDAAQAWLATSGGVPVGTAGDLAIFCLYKSVGIPDGGAVVSRVPVRAAETGGRKGVAPAANLHAAWLAARSRTAAEVRHALPGAPRRPASTSVAVETDAARAEHIFGLVDDGAPASSVSRFLVRRLADPRVALRRRANFELLLAGLDGRVPDAFAHVPDGASPLVFPFETDDVEGTVERFWRAGVEAAPFWTALHPALPIDDFPNALAWRRRFVALPVHQELRAGDIERIAAAAEPPRRRRTELTVEPVDDPETVRDEWTALAEASGNIFGTWEWAASWWEHLGGGQRRISVCRDGNGIVAIVPLYLASRRPVRVLRFIGHGPADQLGPVCDPIDRPRVARALRRAMAGSKDWDVLAGDLLPASEGWSALLGGKIVGTAASPVVEFDGSRDWDDFLATLSPRLRHEIRHDERKLAREHRISYRLANDRARLDADLETLFALHASRWPGSAFSTRHREFHCAFAHRAFERGWLRLWFLEVDERPAAAWYGFRFGGVESHYQGGRDPDWRRSSVGLVVLAHSLRESLRDGTREYRFLRGSESYKYRIASRDPGLEDVLVTRGAVGAAAAAADTASRAARATARPLLRVVTS